MPFVARDPAGFADFWRVYEAHYDAISDNSMRVAAGDPHLARLIAAIPPEQLAALRTDGRRRLQEAVAGAWAAYNDYLQAQGEQYAREGVPFSSWSRLVNAAAADVTTRLVQALSIDAPRLIAALTSKSEYFNYVLSLLGEVYLGTKERELQSSRADLELTLSSIGDGVIATNLDGLVLNMNPAAARLTGWSHEAARGRPLAAFFPPDAPGALPGLPARRRSPSTSRPSRPRCSRAAASRCPSR